MHVFCEAGRPLLFRIHSGNPATFFFPYLSISGGRREEEGRKEEAGNSMSLSISLFSFLLPPPPAGKERKRSRHWFPGRGAEFPHRKLKNKEKYTVSPKITPAKKWKLVCLGVADCWPCIPYWTSHPLLFISQEKEMGKNLLIVSSFSRCWWSNILREMRKRERLVYGNSLLLIAHVRYTRLFT